MTTKSKTKHASTLNTNERKWRQTRLQLHDHLVNKSRGRRELDLPKSSAAVLPWKWCRVRCSDLFKLFLWPANLLNVTTFFCARIDLFTIFVCSRYWPWATIRLLHHFGFVMCINSRWYCMHFSCHWHKIRNVSHRLMQRQHDPCIIFVSISSCAVLS